MMTEEQKSKAAELKAAIVATASAPSGAPLGVREAVVALKKELRRGGTTARTLAAALKVHESTLSRWERESRPAGRAKPAPGASAQVTGDRRSSFRAVELVASEARALRSVSVPASHGLRVMHAPSGLVVDGLDVETLATLLRRMS